MKSFNKLFAGVGLALVMNLVGILGLNAVASAACIEYNANGTSTSTTPVFNNFCNVPDGVGNESDFVRLRPSTGDDTSAANNAAYTDPLSDACNDNAKFDVRTYIHNGASPDYNNNGSGSAVAHNVQLAINAPVNTTNSNFSFKSTISASNAASVTDTGTLNCNGKQVKLTLVPSTVHIYSKQYGGWKSLSDSAVNGTTKLGSPTMGSGDQWACWDYRIVVVYEVQVNVLPPKPVVNAVCSMFAIEAQADRTIRVTSFKNSVQNATFKNVLIDWGDSANNVYTKEDQVVGQSHTFANTGTYHVAATVNFSSNVDNSAIVSSSATSNCYADVTFSPEKPPVVVPPTTPPVTLVSAQQPTTLVNTGAGNILGLFGLSAVAGTLGYRFFLNRRLNRQ